MKQQIHDTIHSLQDQENIRILYTCESGSRAWGFPSPDSDWDVRFIYAHPREWYLELNQKKDCINQMLPNDLDLSGWELAKALRLFHSCNLGLNEWLGSPCIYQKNNLFHQQLHQLIPHYFNAKKGIFHYLSVAVKTLDTHLMGNEIKIKKFFYILRPLLACEWIVQNNSMPPTEFHTLLNQSELIHSVKDPVENYLELKKTAVEGQLIQLSAEVINWLNSQIRHFKISAVNCTNKSNKDWLPLNDIMRNYCF